ncbi:tRNA ligase subunit PheS family protein, partial [Streptococcus sobrinus]
MDLQKQLEELKASTQAKLKEMTGDHSKELQDLRVAVLGKKGSLTELLKGLKDLSNDMRPVIGKQVNEVRDILTKDFEEQAKIVQAAKIQAQLESESLDVTLPGRQVKLGNRHILSQTSEEIEDIFLGMGF